VKGGGGGREGKKGEKKKEGQDLMNFGLVTIAVLRTTSSCVRHPKKKGTKREERKKNGGRGERVLKITEVKPISYLRPEREGNEGGGGEREVNDS